MFVNNIRAIGIAHADLPRATMDDVNPFRRRGTGADELPPGAASPADRALAAAALGDAESFATFYDAVSPVVYGTVLRVVRNPAFAEEVTQEVFVELWRQAARYDRTKGSAAAWAATVAHRRAIDRVRSEESSRARDDRASNVVVPVLDVVAEEVVDEISTGLDRLRVRSALAKLTDTQREAVTLAYYGGNTYREVAILLDVPEGTVKTRIRDGMIKLRDLLEVE